ncbi:rapid alkalinization factor-like [Actinidia eriantha]|uniref:rapid alkalinization factor-like n=1 Tax=Actinidia eriantha TaxID=165200 RepID=UPI00258476A9|nr:rapid alkalinization factor-like [Actinidia eriantha]
MENFSRFGHLLIISTLLILAEVISSTIVEATGNHHHHQWGWTAVKPACQGSIADCMAASEFEMDSESNRRILATTNYISYRALQRNTVPCSQRGASYYNCKPGAKANPYSRGCSSITRCRRS